MYKQSLAMGIVVSPWQGTIIYNQGLFYGHRAGQLYAVREICREVVYHWHPRAGKKVGATIEHCTDEVALKEVACYAPEWTTRDILRQLAPRCHRRMRMAGELQGSSIYEEGFAEGFSVGRFSVTREMCREIVYHWHPRAGRKVWSAIWNSTNLTVLRETACHAAEWTPRQILRRLTAR